MQATDSIDFSIFKNPGNLSQQLGFSIPLNQFKGLMLEMLLEELFLATVTLLKGLAKVEKTVDVTCL